MSQIKPALSYLAGLALVDKDFRESLLADPGRTAASVGIYLTPDQIEKIEELDPNQVEDWVNYSETQLSQNVMAASSW